MDRSDWPDRRIDDLARKLNGLPELVATHTFELKELKDDVAAIRRLIEKESNRRDTNKSARLGAFIAAGGAILASLVSSIALLVTQL